MQAIQTSLFSDYEDEILTNSQTLHIKHKNDFGFDITFNLYEDQDPEQVALEKLGYFIITE